jgi:hypothetical protein
VESLAKAPQDFSISERLPFTVRLAAREDLQEVAAFRSDSYGRHLPVLGATLRKPEPADFELGCEVLVARSKLDGSLLGTMRIHTNVFKYLPLQASLRLPERFRATRMVETTRLCIKGSPNASLVRTAMFKAQFHYCLVQRIDWMMAAGRRPVDRIYEGLRFSDVDEPNMFFPMAHAAGIPHRVMCLSPREALDIWDVDHALYKFIMTTEHKDIDISMATSLKFPWACPDPEIDPDSGLAPLSDFTPIDRDDDARVYLKF